MSVNISNFNVDIRHALQEIQGVLYQLINMKIMIIDGKFPTLSGIEYLTVKQGTVEISPSIIRFSQNQKELHAGFSMNAFSGITGNIFIIFGFGTYCLGSIDSLALYIAPLDPVFLTIASNSTML
ncbi:MAG: hypothetical protein ACI8WT_005005 [Clostridium sp.]|jgi:hypothetical protein